MFCSNCGHELKNGEKHCPICGVPIEYVPKTPVTPVLSPTPNQQEPAPVVQEPVKPQVFVEPINPDKVKKPDNRTEIMVLVTIIAVLLLSAFVFIAVSSLGKDSSTSKKPFTSGAASSVEDGEDGEDSGNAPASNNVVQKEVSSIVIVEEDGVFYNNQGLVNNTYNNSFRNVRFSRDHSACIFLDDKNDLYYLKSDLTARKIDNVVDYGISPDGSYIFCLSSDYELKIIDSNTMKSTALFMHIYAQDLAFSQNGEYICFERADYSSEDIRYEICVYTVDGQEVSKLEIKDMYFIEGLSNDGKTVILRSGDGTGISYFLRDGKVTKIEKSEDINEDIIFTCDMDEALIVSGNVVYHFSAETGEVKEICSANERISVCVKRCSIPLISKVLFENSLEGCVIVIDDQLYWLDADMNTIPFKGEGYYYKGFDVGGTDGRYKFAYYDENEVHIAIYDNGETDDKAVLSSSKRILDITADDDVNNIWAIDYGGDMYHITENSAESVYYNPGSSNYSVDYDSFSERTFFVAKGNKLAYIDSDNKITETDRGCIHVCFIGRENYIMEYYDINYTTYRILLDNYVVMNW